MEGEDACMEIRVSPALCSKNGGWSTAQAVAEGEDKARGVLLGTYTVAVYSGALVPVM